MPAYDTSQFNPPAPVTRVTLRNPATGVNCRDVPMLLDSGADVTLIPHNTVIKLNITPIHDKRYELIGFDGNISATPVVQLELLFCRKNFRGQFLLIEQEWGILGRNILNLVSLLFDGPNLAWDEHRS